MVQNEQNPKSVQQQEIVQANRSNEIIEAAKSEAAASTDEVMNPESLILPEDDSHEVSPQIFQSETIEIGGDKRLAGYSHDDTVNLNYPNWMSKLSDDIRLSELSLPGTHNTMALYGGDSVQCQSMKLDTQLQSGIRVLDIRCRHIDDVFAIHHGMVFQNVFFGDVLNIVIEFLQKNPSETIYMRVKEEYKAEKVTRTFQETFENRYWNCHKSDFWQLPDNSTLDYNPTLKDTRGKIVLLQNFGSSTQYGILWNYLTIQDDYNLATNWDLYKKWLTVKDYLNRANSDTKNIRYVNFLTGSGGSFPYFVASGQSSHQTGAPRLLTGQTTIKKNYCPDFPRVSCIGKLCSIAFEGTNILTAARIGKNKDYSKKSGILMIDFPGPDLIKRIIELNDK